jgi:hypothetical protein
MMWFWSFWEAMAESLPDARIAVLSAKVAMVVAEYQDEKVESHID